jgi:hypothetical protein
MKGASSRGFVMDDIARVLTLLGLMLQLIAVAMTFAR